MTEPNAQLLDGSCPSVHLAGKDWPIPLLAPRQNVVIVPLVLALMPKLVKAVRAGLSVDGLASILDAEGYQTLIRVVYTALTRAHKELTLAEFEDMPIASLELLDAFYVVSQQTGVLKAATPGEAQAGTPQTGTPS